MLLIIIGGVHKLSYLLLCYQQLVIYRARTCKLFDSTGNQEKKNYLIGENEKKQMLEYHCDRL